MSMSHEEFMTIVRETNTKRQHPENWTKVEHLINRIMGCGKLTNEEILVLREEVRQFFTSDASDEDKRKLSGYTEALSMVCAAIDDGLKELIEDKEETED